MNYSKWRDQYTRLYVIYIHLLFSFSIPSKPMKRCKISPVSAFLYIICKASDCVSYSIYSSQMWNISKCQLFQSTFLYSIVRLTFNFLLIPINSIFILSNIYRLVVHYQHNFRPVRRCILRKLTIQDWRCLFAESANVCTQH